MRMPEPTPQPAAPPPAAPEGADVAAARRRRCRWVRRGLIALAVSLVALVAAAVYFTRPAQLTSFVAERLSGATGAAVTVGKATLSWGGELTLDDVAADVPGLPASMRGYARLFDAERVTVQLGLSSWWRGRVAVRELGVESPRLHLVEDLDAGRLNLELLTPPRGGGGMPVTLPAVVDVQGARVVFKQLADGELNTIDTMRLEGELRESGGDAPGVAGRYGFELRELGVADAVDSTLAGEVDLMDVGLMLRLEGFSVERPHRYLVPTAFRRVWDALDPEGELPALELTLRANARGTLELTGAVLELRGLSITPPYGDLGLLPGVSGVQGTAVDEPYRPRMREVSGRFVVDREWLRVEGLSGVIEGVRYEAEGRWSIAPDGPGRLSVSTEPFEVDQDPRYLAALPMVGSTLFQRLSPSGRFTASFTVEKPGGGHPVASGVVEALGASARYAKFPYPLEHVTGKVTFDPTAVRIESMRCTGPGGGTITVDGVIAPPGEGAAVSLDITARGVPLDDDVLAALGDEPREAVARLFDRERYRELVEEGVIRSGEGEPVLSTAGGGDGSPPMFDLGGELSVDVAVRRPAGHDVETEVTTAVDVAGLRALMRGWPYPLIGRSGRVVVDRGGVTVDRVVVAGLTGATGTVTGRLDRVAAGEMPLIALDLGGVSVPLDKMLLHSIRSPVRQRLADLHLDGRFDGGGRVFRSATQSDPDWLISGDVLNASVTPYGGRFTLDRITGRAIVDRYSLTLSDVTSRHGDASVDVLGRFDWGTTRAAALSVNATGMTVEPALVDLLEPGSDERARLVELMRRYEPRGTFDARLRVSEGPGPGAGGEARVEPVQVTVEPHAMDLTLGGRRLGVTGMTGRARVTPGRVDVQALGGRVRDGGASGAAGGTGGAGFTVDGLVGLDGVTDTALSFTAEADAADPAAHAVLPPAVVAVLERLNVTGTVRVTDARVLRRVAPAPAPAPPPGAGADAGPADTGNTDTTPSDAAGPARFELDAAVQLDGLAADPGFAVTDLVGRLRVGVRSYDHQPRPRLDLALDADRLRVVGRLVQPLRLGLDNAGGDPDQLHLRGLVGGVYGGLVVGEGTVPLDPAGHLRLALILTGAAVDPLLKPTEHDPLHPDAPPVPPHAPPTAPPGNAPTRTPYVDLNRDPDAGVASASLDLNLPLNDPTQRLGRGAIALRDAALYDRPVATALLRATSFTLPSGSPLDTLDVRYVLDGSLVTLDAITFTGPRLELSGTGTVTLPGQELDLVLVSRDDQAIHLGPLSDLVNLVKDELVTLRVGGTLTAPEARIVSLRGLRQTWADLFRTTRARPDSRDNVIAGPVGPR